jgi:hypothetical protein
MIVALKLTMNVIILKWKGSSCLLNGRRLVVLMFLIFLNINKTTLF